MNVTNDSPNDEACARTREQLSAIADGELSTSAEIARHVERCAECAEFAAQCAVLSSSFAPLRELDPPPHVAAHVWTRIEERLAHGRTVPPRTRHAWRARIGSALAGMAASIALAFTAERLCDARSNAVRGEAERALNVLARVARDGDDLRSLDARPERQLVRAHLARTEKTR